MTRLTKVLLLVLLIATTASAQEWFRGYGRGFNRVPPRLPKADSYDGSFSFCRGLFSQYRGEPSGSGWRPGRLCGSGSRTAASAYGACPTCCNAMH